MGLFSPRTLSFIYERYSNNSPRENVNYYPSPNEGPINVRSKPNWVNVLLSSDSTASNPVYIIQIDSVRANALPDGAHNGMIEFEDSTPGSLPTVGMQIYVSLNVIPNQHLYVTPKNFVQTYTIGGGTELAQRSAPNILTILTPNSWTITAAENWINFNKNSGNGDDTVIITPSPTGLSEGTYTSNILVDDGQSQEVVTFVYKIIGSEVEEEYLTVSSDFLNYSQNKSTTTEFKRRLVITASDDITIEANKTWVDLSSTNFPEGAHTLIVGIKNADNLAIGMHHAVIDVSTPYLDKQIDVYLTVVKTEIAGIKSNTLYFAHDRNEIHMTNAQSNQEALFNYIVQANQGSERFTEKVPYFENTLNNIIGLRNEVFMSFSKLEKDLDSFFNSSPVSTFIDPVVPTNWRITVSDKTIGNSIVDERINVNDVLFINGQNPLDALRDRFKPIEIEQRENLPNIEANSKYVKYSISKSEIKNINLRLTYIPTRLVLPVDAMLSLSYFFYSSIVTGGRVVTISGSITDSIQGNPLVSDTDFYSCLINLKQYQFKKGDRITIDAGVVSTKITFVEPSLPTTQIIWVNEWGFPEIYNATGPIKIRGGAERETTLYTQNGQDYNKIIKAKSPIDYEVDLGKIYYQEEIDYIQTMFLSDKIWLNINSRLVEVIPDTRGIDILSSREFIKERKISFKKAII